MPAPPHQSRRTTPVVLLRRLLVARPALRRLAGGRGDGSRSTWLVLTAAVGVLAATAVSVVVSLWGPGRSSAVDPPPGPGIAAPSQAGTAAGQSVTAADPDPSTRSSPTPTPRKTSPSSTPSNRPDTPPSVPAASIVPSSTAPSTRPKAKTTSAPVPQPSVIPLAATFALDGAGVFSYGAAVTIDNPASTAVTGWSLVVTLPRDSLNVTSVTGARATRSGATWTFAPDDSNGQVPGNQSVRVTFRVSGTWGSSAPTACTIDGVACAGLSN
ncbi:cellulose binding domain-containing protein [Micromonospora sp. WMMA1923]|uniref:cellulose binding domain-containing protein n=1 Tax=Micromonospora sp. WMMA1923 TaxID=3404125 RepID=UPI003B94F8E2